jgi:hypothetical protein
LSFDVKANIAHIRQNSSVATVTYYGIDNEIEMNGEGSRFFQISSGAHLEQFCKVTVAAASR